MTVPGPAASVLRAEIVAIAGVSPGSSWCVRYPAAVVIRYDWPLRKVIEIHNSRRMHPRRV